MLLLVRFVMPRSYAPWRAGTKAELSTRLLSSCSSPSSPPLNGLYRRQRVGYSLVRAACQRVLRVCRIYSSEAMTMRRDVCRTPAQRVGLDMARIPIDREREYGLLGDEAVGPADGRSDINSHASDRNSSSSIFHLHSSRLKEGMPVRVWLPSH